MTGRRWGRWRLNTINNTLEFWLNDRQMVYYIDLDRMGSAAACLDWVFQVAFKTWMTPQDTQDMLRAIRDTVDPQAHLCSWASGQSA